MNNIVFKLFPILTLFIFLCVSSGCGTAQNTSKSESAQNVIAAIDSNSWTFTALNVQPQTGNAQMVNGVYSVIYAPGKLNVYLPYFGRAFGGANVYNSSKSVLDFITTDFSVDKQQESERKWTIVMKAKDQREIQSMTFTFFSNGSGTLSVILTNRSPISFTGTVAPTLKR